MFRIKCYRKDLRPDFCASHALPNPRLRLRLRLWQASSRSVAVSASPRASHPATCFMIIYELSPLKYKCCVYELSFSDCKCKCASGSVAVCVCVSACLLCAISRCCLDDKASFEKASHGSAIYLSAHLYIFILMLSSRNGRRCCYNCATVSTVSIVSTGIHLRSKSTIKMAALSIRYMPLILAALISSFEAAPSST